ncbi:MAG: cytochrome P450 [Acidiferrobacterales bacterium]|nr:cytochrome P450 [Acidiferrobacterales bacterium]
MDVGSPEFLANPYQFYDQRRRETPAFKRDATTWTLTGYDILAKVLAHPAVGRGNVGQKPRPDGDSSELLEIRDDNLALQIMEQWMLFQNPPIHTINRRFISDVFTLKMIQQLEGLMRDIMRKLIDDIKKNNSDSKTFDLIKSIAYPYPANVICEMIGIPRQDRQRFAEWTRSFSLAVQVDFIEIDEHSRAKLNETAREISDYFDQLISLKKSQKSDDLISRLIQGSDEPTSHIQLLSNCVFLLFAGQETTTSLISNAIHALLTNPEQLALLKADPTLIDNTVEECLRYDPSIQMVGRFALDDVEFDSIKIKKGDHIFAFLGAAGRDPNTNSDPHTFDITRKKIKHLAFARGAHHCLGASLARLEIKVMLQELIAAFPNLALAGDGVRRPTWLMRGFDRLPLSFQSHHISEKLSEAETIAIKLPSQLYPFRKADLSNITYRNYQLENVFEKITEKQRQECVQMWMQHSALPSEQLARQRTDEVCYLIRDIKSGIVVGVNTLYRGNLNNSVEEYFFNRMYIQPEHRSSRLMITGTAAMLCFAKHYLCESGALGIININENSKLSRPGMQRIFNRLGYRHFGWSDKNEIILFSFHQVEFF